MGQSPFIMLLFYMLFCWFDWLKDLLYKIVRQDVLIGTATLVLPQWRFRWPSFSVMLSK